MTQFSDSQKEIEEVERGEEEEIGGEDCRLKRESGLFGARARSVGVSVAAVSTSAALAVGHALAYAAFAAVSAAFVVTSPSFSPLSVAFNDAMSTFTLIVVAPPVGVAVGDSAEDVVILPAPRPADEGN